MSTVIYNDAGQPLLYVPDWFAGQATRLLRYVNAATTSDSALRKKICEREPLIFALVYLSDQMSSEETLGKRSLNPLHIFLAEDAATYWPFPLKPKECRRIIVAPRDAGKTTWQFLILPLWAAAYGWRIFQLFLSASGDTAEEHLGNLKYELQNNDLLRADFPELCEPMRARGRTVGDTKQVFRAESGVTFMARGIDAHNLGRKEGKVRPDLIVCDDVELIGRRSKMTKEQRLHVIRNGLLPMNLNAAVYIVGTVVRYGSIIHDAVLADSGNGLAEWIAQESFVTKYWPVYTINSRTGVATSFWPEKWPMKFIRSQLHIDSFQMSYMNQPQIPGNGLFSAADLHYGAPFRTESHILAIDPAVTSKETSDYTGIAVIGFDGGLTRAYVEYAKGVRLPPDRLQELIRLLLLQFPTISTVVVEANQGGDWVTKQIRTIIPKHIRYLTPHEHAPKPERIRELHLWSQLKWVFVGPDAHAYVDQALSYPDTDFDDVIDAVAKGCYPVLSRLPMPVPR
jgi:phage terminase large subunit-like protein